ncbi:hypothetical protein NJ7G_0915 [Natrinema sp. J7-2]|uniref:DUF8108 domain-containing protein n=2 Tax=Natrialbaceae TaxID=1644061 RepID=L9ZCZ3_9EURY|nr:hypothetical protein NJ7G_0915 [Natrinema sp. J7-2]ELY83881.1 hypothetical protein C486_01589 [Natrinema gari JCM 14663]
MERVIDDYITQGYQVKSQGERSARVKDKDWGSALGHLIVAALTLWWTLGIGNVAYAAYKRYTADEVTIKVDHDDSA